MTDLIQQIEAYAPFRAAMRRKHGYCGPCRLGIAIGEGGSELGPPEHYLPVSEKSFWQGVEVGKRRAAALRASQEVG